MAEKQRQLRDDETKTIEERIKANEELSKVLDEGQKKERENIEARIGIIQMQNNLLGKTKERTNEILSLQQELTGIDAKYAGLKSEQLTNINSLEKEKIELKRAEVEGTLEANKIIADSEAELAAEGMDQFEKKMAAIQQEYEARRKLLDDEISQLKEGTQAYVDATNEKKVLDAQYTADTKALAKERADYETEQAKLVAENQMSAVMGALSGVQSLVGENSKFGKALAVSMAIIDTYSGATKALAQGGTFGFIGAAGVIASGLANVRAIMQQELPGVEGDSSGGGGVSMSAPSGPNVGIISGQINSSAQLLGSLNNSLSTPPRAYVVGQDVNSQQSLDRHIRQNATL
jgi:phage host-nuclease inhibitor protein Gam